MNKKDKKTWITSSFYYLGTIILGVEIPRIYYRQFTIKIIETGKDSFLFKSGLVDKNDSIFDFYHLVTNYLPILVFIFIMPFLFSQHLHFKRIIIWATSILSLLLTLLVSKEYLDYSRSWYFIPQIGILISFSLTTIFFIKGVDLRKKCFFFFVGLLTYSFFSKAFEPLIMKLKYDILSLPYGKIHLVILSVYLLSTFLYYYYQKKK